MTSLEEQLRLAHSCRMTLTDEQPAREDDYDQRPHYRYRCGREHVQRHSLATAGPLWCYATLPEPQIIYTPTWLAPPQAARAPRTTFRSDTASACPAYAAAAGSGR